MKLVGSDGQWLFCNGSAVSRNTYQILFAVIGTTYGQGDGINTFNLPDLQARFPLGSSAINDTVLVSGGSASHILTISELPAHDPRGNKRTSGLQKYGSTKKYREVP